MAVTTGKSTQTSTNGKVTKLAPNAKKNYYTCPLCEANCGIVVHTEGNKIAKITGDKDDPFSKGYICPKSRAIEELYNDPNRLRQPQRKLANGEFEPISWDEAFSTVAAKLNYIRKEHGNDAVSLYLGNPNSHNTVALLYLFGLFEVLQTKNRFSSTSVDQLPTMLTAWKLYGHQILMPIPDIDRTKYMIVLGANPLASNGSIMSAPDIKKRLRAISERGGKLVVIDPRRTATAELADQHLSIKPGSDAILLLAMLNVILKEDVDDWQRGLKLGALESIIVGTDAIERLLGHYTPEQAAKYTGISAEDIRTLAREYKAADGAVLYPRLGVSVHEYGGLVHYLTNLLSIITGNLDKTGGMMFTTPAIDTAAVTALGGMKGSFGSFHSRVSGKPEFNQELPVSVLAEEIETPGPGQIKSMITVAGNPVLSNPGGQKLDKAFDKLDFMVSIDIYINETTRHADIILPPRIAPEREEIDAIFPLLSVRNHVKYSPPALEPAKGDDTKPDEDIYSELISRLALSDGPLSGLQKGFASFLKRFGPIRLLDMALRLGKYGDKFNPFSSGLSLAKLKKMPHGVDLGPLQSCLPDRLFTENKKINVDQGMFINDIERLKKDFPPDGEAESDDKLILIGRRDLRSNNSWMHNLPRLQGARDLCTLFIHPIDAEERGIISGTKVKLKSATGEIEVKAEIDDSVMPGVISLPHGYGHTNPRIRMDHAHTKNAGVNCNELVDPTITDKLCGTSALNSTKVEVLAI